MDKRINRVIYRLWHNRSISGGVGYIGKDKRYPNRVNLDSRKKDKNCLKLYRALNKYPLSVWRTEILAQGFRTDKALSKAEIFYIKKFKTKVKGYNCTDGGEGNSGHLVSAEAREKMSKAHRGRKLSAEHIAKMIKSRKGYRHSVRTKAKISKAHRGMRLSSETIAILRATHIGKKLSVEHIAKIIKSRKGYRHSAKTRAKIGEAHRGKKESAETIAKLVKSHLGHRLSFATRAKISIAQKAVKHTTEQYKKGRKTRQAQLFTSKLTGLMIGLRKRGLSLAQIKETCRLNVSNSTVYRHIVDMK